MLKHVIENEKKKHNKFQEKCIYFSSLATKNARTIEKQWEIP